MLVAFLGARSIGLRVSGRARVIELVSAILLLQAAAVTPVRASGANEHAAPAVVIESSNAGGQRYSPKLQIALPSGITQFQVQFASTDRTRNDALRHQLDGVDDNGQMAADQRKALYTNLEPSTYRFQVAALNSDNLASAPAADFAVSIEPTFFQTVWFRGSCAAAALLILFAAYRSRMHHVMGHLRALQHERMIERERIARDLHDTLLQEIQGLIVRLQGVVLSMGADDALRSEIQATLAAANKALAEGRDKVVGLRAASGVHDNLADAFSQLARDVAQGPVPTFTLAKEGVERICTPLMCDEIYRIGAEAIINSFRHANASNIDVAISYGVKQIRLRVRDDGRGIPDNVRDSGNRPGHWGLPGMGERAARIGARLLLRTEVGVGTEVELLIPASVAYSNSLWATIRRWLKRLRQQAA